LIVRMCANSDHITVFISRAVLTCYELLPSRIIYISITCVHYKRRKIQELLTSVSQKYFTC